VRASHRARNSWTLFLDCTRSHAQRLHGAKRGVDAARQFLAAGIRTEAIPGGAITTTAPTLLVKLAAFRATGQSGTVPP